MAQEHFLAPASNANLFRQLACGGKYLHCILTAALKGLQFDDMTVNVRVESANSMGGSAALTPFSHAQQKHSDLPYNKTVIAASMASISSVIMGSPFDSIKVRMQTQGANSTYSSSWHCAKLIFKQEGVRGFFRGILVPLTSVNLVKTVSVGVYEGSRFNLFSQFYNIKYKSQKTAVNEYNVPLAVSVYFSSGFLAGLVSSVLSCPMEMIRNQRIIYDHQIQTHNNKISASTLNYARALIKSHGFIGGLYTGYGLHVARESFGTGTYWLIYEMLHYNLNKIFTKKSFFNASDSDHISRSQFIDAYSREKGNASVHFISGGLTGMLAWLIIFPVDLVKNIYQKHAFNESLHFKSSASSSTIKTISYKQIFKQIYSQGGIRGLYCGVWPTMMRAFPIHGFNLLFYEYLLKVLP